MAVQHLIGTQADKIILEGLFLGSKYKGIKAVFSSASSILTGGRVKSLQDLAKLPAFKNAVKKLSKAEITAYTKHLQTLGFPTLAIQEGKVVGLRMGKARAAITTQKIAGLPLSGQKVLKVVNQHINFLKEESFFQKAHKQAKVMGIIQRTEESRAWYQDYALEQGVNFRSMDMLRTGGRRVSDIRLGRMYFFRYRPEQPEDTYDEFPLIFLLSEEPDTFDGINFHYLSPKLRAVLLGKMLMYLNNQDYTDRTKLFARKFRGMIQTNKRFRHAKVIYKRYKADDVKSKILQVHPLDWELAITVPTERFKTVSGGRTMSKKIWLKSAKLAKNL